MQALVSDKIYTVEEYIKHEWTASERSEFINGQLFEMPGEKDINNEIAGVLYILLVAFLKSKGYHVYNHDVKVKITGESKYYYPDIFVTKEVSTLENTYIKSEPILIIEVFSVTSQVHDYVDKYMDYTKIPSLQYYLIVEPETTLITCYKRAQNNEWTTEKYFHSDDLVRLETLNVSFPLKQVYSS